jgi:hypothetical protein
MRPALILALLALLALALAGCGEDAKTKADLGQARSVVQRFAAAEDASACDLLDDDALVNVYGNFKSPAVGKANCVKKSAKFKGDQVKIIRSELLDDLTAKVVAHSSDGKFSYSVNLRRLSGSKPWRISSIAQAKLTS